MSAPVRPSATWGTFALYDGRSSLLVPHTHVLRGSEVVDTKVGVTKRHAHRRALLVLAKILEKDLTATYQH